MHNIQTRYKHVFTFNFMVYSGLNVGVKVFIQLGTK